MNAATAIPANSRDEIQITQDGHAERCVARAACVVTPFPGLDLAGAAWLACREMALDRDEYDATLGGKAVTDRVPPLAGEGARAYGERAASEVMVAYLVGWDG